MNEFRRPYEYDDENGVAGFILVFFLMLVGVEPLICFNLANMGRLILAPVPVLYVLFIAAFVIHFGLLLFTCIALFRIRRLALKAVKAYLLYRLILLTLSAVMIFITYLIYHLSPNAAPSMYKSVFELILYILVIPLAYIIPFSILWNIYFNRSKRVKTTYLKQ